MGLAELKSLKRKKYQRAVNKLVRDFNKIIKKDWLWNGRFMMRQGPSWFTIYSDHSGAQFEFILILTDIKTGRKEAKVFNNYNCLYQMWHWANECIVTYWKVWSENPNPCEQAHFEGRELPKWKEN